MCIIFDDGSYECPYSYEIEKGGFNDLFFNVVLVVYK